MRLLTTLYSLNSTYNDLWMVDRGFCLICVYMTRRAGALAGFPVVRSEISASGSARLLM